MTTPPSTTATTTTSQTRVTWCSRSNHVLPSACAQHCRAGVAHAGCLSGKWPSSPISRCRRRQTLLHRGPQLEESYHSTTTPKPFSRRLEMSLAFLTFCHSRHGECCQGRLPFLADVILSLISGYFPLSFLLPVFLLSRFPFLPIRFD